MINTSSIKHCIAIAGLLMSTQPAQAHVVLDRNEAQSNSYYKATFRVGHGCNGSATIAVRVRIPEGVASVRPQPKPGWKVDIAASGKTVSEVSWSGNRLADEHFDEFALLMRLPDRPGAMLYFPVTQECEQGVSRWIETPAPNQPARELKSPAPALKLTR